MIRMEFAEPPEPPDAPPGISIRPYERSDARLVHEVIDDAFSEWPGRDPEPYEVWAPQAIAHPAFEPALSPLAFDGEELVGAVLSQDFSEEGWIDQLATKATHRRRGIAQALLRTALGGFYERGRPMAGVSTDSRTGALGLYEKVGMRVVRQYTPLHQALDRPDGGRGIRTREAVAHLHALQACPFVRSGRPPRRV